MNILNVQKPGPEKQRRLRAELLEQRVLLVGDLLITELMARNSDTLMDQDGDSSDWFEVHNSSAEAVDINGWYLTDDATDLTKWQVATAGQEARENNLEPSQYRVIFASGKNRTDPAGELHTNFRLNGTGEFLALVKPNGTTISHQYMFPEQSPDVSYGLQSLDVSQQVFFQTSTPGKPNGDGFLGFVANPTFAGDPQQFHGRGFYDAPFHLNISSATSGATISYTTDGSLPSLDNGMVVVAPDDQTAATATVQIKKTTTLRAVALKDRHEPSQTGTQTYLFAADIVQQSAEPEGFPNFRYRDFNATPDGTFLVDLADGTYTVQLSLGDEDQVRDNMAIHVQGSLVETLTTAASEFVDRTFQVEVSGATNEQLALRLEDRGGVTDEAVINSLVITPNDGGEPKRFDFGVGKSLVQPGYERVIASDSYNAGDGFGWQPGTTVTDRDRDPGGSVVRFGMDPDIVADNLDTLSDDLKSLPTLSLVGDVDDWFGARRGIYTNWGGRGRVWERPISMEYFDPQQPDRQIQVDAGVRIHGNDTRGSAQKNLRLYFRSEYGDTKLRFPLFPGTDAASFDQITLGFVGDNSSSHATFVRDRYSHQALLDMGQLASHGTPVHVYLNGAYWGLYWATERPDNAFAALHLGGEKEEWDSVRIGAGDGFRVLAGNLSAWSKMMSIKNLALDSNYERIQEYLDVDNFIDYMISSIHLFLGHWEFYAARRRAPGEGFKFFTWDADTVLTASKANLTRTNIGDNHPTNLFQRLRENAQFRRRFADRVHQHLFNDGALTVEAMQALWKDLTDQVERAVVPASARWRGVHLSDDYTREDSWIPAVERVHNEVIPERYAFSLEDFQEAGLYPLFDAPVFNQPSGSIEPGFDLTMDGPGEIYFTLDSSDPSRDFAQFQVMALLDQGNPARALVPTDGSLGTAWTEPNFDDSSWKQGMTGVGFDVKEKFDPFIGLDLETEMYRTNDSAYIRIPFEVTDTSDFAKLVLRMKYEDGFLAYLNGVEIANGNTPDDPQWNSRSSRFRRDSDALEFEDFDVTQFLYLLKPGQNVLAIHGLNQNTTNDDFLINPRLEAQVITDAGTAASAMRYNGQPIRLLENTVVKARSLLGTDWSAVNVASFTVGAPMLRISEIMFHPQDAPTGSPLEDDDFEFVELVNTATTSPLELRDFALTQGIQFTFPQMTLEPGQRVVVVRNRAAFETRYGTDIPIAGQYGGTADDWKLSNGGETLRLEDANGQLIQQFAYDDAWYPQTDGGASSLEIIDASNPNLEVWGQRAGWLPSGQNGTPGTAGTTVDADFDDNGSVDARDIDLLAAEVASPSGQDMDLTNDAQVNELDIVHLVENILNTRFGDLNLDGVVNQQDFETLALNFASVGGWSDGDSDGDGDIDFRDFNRLANNFGFDGLV